MCYIPLGHTLLALSLPPVHCPRTTERLGQPLQPHTGLAATPRPPRGSSWHLDQVTVCTESKPADETLNAPTLDDKMALVNQKAESKVSLTMLMTSLTVPYPIRPPLIADCPYPVSEPLRASSPCPMRCCSVELAFSIWTPLLVLCLMICCLLCYLLSPFLTVRRSFPLTFLPLLCSRCCHPLCHPRVPPLLYSIISPPSSHSLPYTSAIINLVEILGMLVR